MTEAVHLRQSAEDLLFRLVDVLEPVLERVIQGLLFLGCHEFLLPLA